MDDRTPRQEALVAALAAYVPWGEEDRRAAAETARFVRAHADFWRRSLEEGHVTASAWILDGSGRALLTHHAKLGRWVQLGGHIEDGDAGAREAAAREAREESGLTSLIPASGAIFDVDVHPIPARAGEPAHVHYDVRFLFTADGGEPLQVSAESHRLAWVGADGLPALSQEASVTRMWRKGRGEI